MSFDALTLECFLAVAELGSFTRAAERVGRTQSAVSQQVNKLESLLNKTLFIRGKQLTLTLDGEILLTYAQKIIQLNRDVMDRFKQPELQGEVRFGLPEDFATVFLSDVLSEYVSLHPRILLNVECDLTLNLFERFKKREFDLVLVKMNRPQDFFNGTDVWSEALEWVGRYSFENGDVVPLVLSPAPCVYRARAIEALERNNIKWRIVFSSHSYASTVAAVKAGMGITVLSRNMVPEGVHVVSNLSNLPALDNTHISLLKHSDDNVAINSFEQFVIDRLKP